MRTDRFTIKAQEALAVQQHVIDPLAKRLLEGSIKPGQTITVDANGADELAFTSSK